jgi:serine/threonine-protein kinase RsbW
MLESEPQREWPEPVEWHEVYPNTPDGVRRAMRRILSYFPSPGVHSMSFGIHLCIEEAIMNATRHGNVLLRDGVRMKDHEGIDVPDPSRHFRVIFSINAHRIRIEIENECVVPFDPAEVPNCTEDENLEKPSGRGIELQRHFSSRARWNGGEYNNRVSLEWHRPWQGRREHIPPEEPFLEDGPWLLDGVSDLTGASGNVRVSLSSSLGILPDEGNGQGSQ